MSSILTNRHSPEPVEKEPLLDFSVEKLVSSQQRMLFLKDFFRRCQGDVISCLQAQPKKKKKRKQAQENTQNGGLSSFTSRKEYLPYTELMFRVWSIHPLFPEVLDRFDAFVKNSMVPDAQRVFKANAKKVFQFLDDQFSKADSGDSELKNFSVAHPGKTFHHLLTNDVLNKGSAFSTQRRVERHRVLMQHLSEHPEYSYEVVDILFQMLQTVFSSPYPFHLEEWVFNFGADADPGELQIAFGVFHEIDWEDRPIVPLDAQQDDEDLFAFRLRESLAGEFDGAFLHDTYASAQSAEEHRSRLLKGPFRGESLRRLFEIHGVPDDVVRLAVELVPGWLQSDEQANLTINQQPSHTRVFLNYCFGLVSALQSRLDHLPDEVVESIMDRHAVPEDQKPLARQAVTIWRSHLYDSKTMEEVLVTMAKEAGFAFPYQFRQLMMPVFRYFDRAIICPATQVVNANVRSLQLAQSSPIPKEVGFADYMFLTTVLYLWMCGESLSFDLGTRSPVFSSKQFDALPDEKQLLRDISPNPFTDAYGAYLNALCCAFGKASQLEAGNIPSAILQRAQSVMEHFLQVLRHNEVLLNQVRPQRPQEVHARSLELHQHIDHSFLRMMQSSTRTRILDQLFERFVEHVEEQAKAGFNVFETRHEECGSFLEEDWPSLEYLREGLLQAVDEQDLLQLVQVWELLDPQQRSDEDPFLDQVHDVLGEALQPALDVEYFAGVDRDKWKAVFLEVFHGVPDQEMMEASEQVRSKVSDLMLRVFYDEVQPDLLEVAVQLLDDELALRGNDDLIPDGWVDEYERQDYEDHEDLSEDPAYSLQSDWLQKKYERMLVQVHKNTGNLADMRAFSLGFQIADEQDAFYAKIRSSS